MPSAPFSLRVDTATLSKLDARSRGTGESKSRLAQRYIEEGLRMEDHPGIVFRDGPVGRRPAVCDGLDVWELIGAFESGPGFSEQEIGRVAKSLCLTTVQVRAAVGYYAAYREEIDAWIRRNNELAERLEADWLRRQELIAG